MTSSKGPSGTGAREAPDAWQATSVATTLATKLLGEDADDGPARHEIGRLVGPNERELFVACEPALAMLQQFEHHASDFIAVHDVATSASRKLIAGIAAAASQPVQKLAIRRQGYGTPLAVIEYVELPTSDGSTLRLYSTDSDTDSASRAALARVLMSFSRLAVVMVGDLPSHAMAGAFKALHEDLHDGTWRNRNMLLLPLSAPGALVSQAAELGRETMVEVRVTPQVTRPADVWSFISGAWTRLHSDNVPPPRPVVRPPAAPAEPLRMRPMPAVPQAAPRTAAAPANLIERYVRQLAELTGVLSVCVFDIATGRDVAHAGASPSPAELGSHGAELMASIFSSSRNLGLGHAMPDVAITLGAHHLLLRPVPRHAGLAIHAVLDKGQANLTLARLQVQRLDALFEAEGAPPR